MFATLLRAALWAIAVQALSPAEWEKQSIYQVMTDRFARTDGSTAACADLNNYCGGSWVGIINHLDYIQSMGFTAVWISPVVKNIDASTSDGSGYHGYWAQDIYALNENFGTAQDLVDLSTALHNRGMYLMVDIVTNHFAYAGCGDCVDYSSFTPFNAQSYFHPFCLIDYSNATSEKVCWEGDNTVALADLRTEDTDVRTMWNNWITDLVSNYSIDGLRIDSVTEVEPSFWPGFEDAAGVFLIGEVYDGNQYDTPTYLDVMDGVLNYPYYFWLKRAFNSTAGTMDELYAGINSVKSMMNTSTLGGFIENHDQVRFPSLTSDIVLAQNVIGFTMLMDGIPVIYQGQEQHYSGGATPSNREVIWTSGFNEDATLYKWISSMNAIRSWAISKDSSYTNWQAVPTQPSSHIIALRKGTTGSQVVSVFTNVGSSGSSSSVTLTTANTGFTSSQSLTEITSCKTYTTDSSGSLTFTMGTTPLVFYPTSELSGSSICSSSSSSGSCTNATSVAVTFDFVNTTVYGDTIKIAGSVSALGSWAPSAAVALSAADYTASNPLWSTTVDFAPGTQFEYKYINVDASGTVTWEADPNRSFSVPASCATAATVTGSWQS